MVEHGFGIVCLFENGFESVPLIEYCFEVLLQHGCEAAPLVEFVLVTELLVGLGFDPVQQVVFQFEYVLEAESVLVSEMVA